MGSLVCVDGLGGCGGRMLVGWYEGLLVEGFSWWRLRGARWGWAGSCMGGRTWLDAEAVEGGLVAGGWRGMVSSTVVAFGVCCWDGMVVGVDGWLLAGCWLRLRRLLFRMGVAVGLWLGVCGVVGRLVGPWCWAGELNTSQCSAFQSGWESAWG